VCLCGFVGVCVYVCVCERGGSVCVWGYCVRKRASGTDVGV
jgi:hypothetical protein